MAKKADIEAVALVVTNPSGHILVLQEFETKEHLGKYAGMYSIPMETCEPRDEPHQQTLLRLHTQELGGLCGLVLPGVRIGEYWVTANARATLYATTYHSHGLPITSDMMEIGNHEWTHPLEAMERWLRRGALEMIQHFVADLREVVCHELIEPLHPSMRRESLRNA